MPTPDRLHPAPFIAGLAGATTVTLVGVWLVVAPFAVGYQPDGAEWVDATIVGVASGAAMILLGLLTLLVTAAGLRAEVRERGLAPTARPEPADGEPEVAAVVADEDQSQPVHAGDLDTILASLAAALLEDLRNDEPDPDPGTTPPRHRTTPAPHRSTT